MGMGETDSRGLGYGTGYSLDRWPAKNRGRRMNRGTRLREDVLSEQWVRVKKLLPRLHRPIFHKTQNTSALRVASDGLRARIGSYRQGYHPDVLPGAGISFARSFEWAEGQDIPGDFVFVFDQADFPKRMFKSFQDPAAPDEFEERYWGDRISPEKIKAVIVLRPMHRYERGDWEVMPFPVIEKSKGGWRSIHEGTQLEHMIACLRGNR